MVIYNYYEIKQDIINTIVDNLTCSDQFGPNSKEQD